MKWLTKLADVLVGAQRVIGLARLLAAALAGAVAASASDAPPPAEPPHLGIECYGSFSNSPAQTPCNVPNSASQ